MNRRHFLSTIGGATAVAWLPYPAWAVPREAGYQNLLVLIELKGGNDGLNTVVPYADAQYYALRPRLAISRDQVLQLDAHCGLHPALQPLLPVWAERELAVVQGVGYPGANLSHFRSIEIWDTGSRSSEYLADGWLARAFARTPVPRGYAADGVVIGSAELGPLAGSGARAIALSNTEQFLRQARLAAPAAASANPALTHVLRVEQDIMRAAAGLNVDHPVATDFPTHALGNAFKTAAQVIASKAGVAVIRITHNGYDTHSAQANVHNRLLKELAEGLAAMRAALRELGRWDSALMLTYAEFGRRARENQSAGTDHGTASAHLALGGSVKGGLYGQRPAFDRLDGNGNLPFAVDFREIYATALARWWGLDASATLQGRFAPVEFLRA